MLRQGAGNLQHLVDIVVVADGIDRAPYVDASLYDNIYTTISFRRSYLERSCSTISGMSFTPVEAVLDSWRCNETYISSSCMALTTPPDMHNFTSHYFILTSRPWSS